MSSTTNYQPPSTSGLRRQIALAGTGVVMLTGFLLIHVVKDLTAETAAWYFHSTPVWLIVMAMPTGICLRELSKLKKEGTDVNALFRQLPPA